MSTSKQNGAISSSHPDPDPDPEMDYHPHQLASNSLESELEMDRDHAEGIDWWQERNRQSEGMIPEEMMEEGCHHSSVHRDAAYYHQYPDQRGYSDDHIHPDQGLEAYDEQRRSYLHPNQYFHSYSQPYPHTNHHPDHTPFTPEPKNYYDSNLNSSRSKLGSSGLRNQISSVEDQNQYEVEATPTKIKRKELGGDYVQLHPWGQPVRVKRGRDVIDEGDSRGKVGKKEKLEREGSSHKFHSGKAAKKSQSKKSNAISSQKLETSKGEDRRLQDEDGGDFPPAFPETHCLIIRIRPFNSLSSLGPKPPSSTKKSNNKQSESPIILKSGIKIFQSPQWKVRIDEFVQLQYEINQERLSNTPSLTSSESLDHCSSKSNSNSNRTSTPSPIPSSTSKILESLSPRSRKGLMIYQKRKSEVEKRFEFLPTAFDNRSHRNFLASRLIDSSSSSSSEEKEYRSSSTASNEISLASGTKKKGIDLKRLWGEWVRRELQSRERKSSEDGFGEKKRKTFEIEKPFFEVDERNSRGPYLERNLRRGIELRELELESKKR